MGVTNSSGLALRYRLAGVWTSPVPPPPLVCMPCVCAWMDVCMCMQMYTFGCLPLPPSLFFFKRGSFIETEDYTFGFAPILYMYHPHPPPMARGSETCMSTPGSYVSALNLNAGLHSSQASPSPAGPSPQLSMYAHLTGGKLLR